MAKIKKDEYLELRVYGKVGNTKINAPQLVLASAKDGSGKPGVERLAE
jgi:hypothetical protein